MRRSYQRSCRLCWLIGLVLILFLGFNVLFLSTDNLVVDQSIDFRLMKRIEPLNRDVRSEEDQEFLRLDYREKHDFPVPVFTERSEEFLLENADYRIDNRRLSPEPNIFFDRNLELIISQDLVKLTDRCEKFRKTVFNSSISDVRPATWSKCGRPDNAFAIFSDSRGQFCIRYRHPHNHHVANELLAYHLSNLLGIQTVPCVQLSVTNTSRSHSFKLIDWPVSIDLLNWISDAPIALVEWIFGLKGNQKLPTVLLHSLTSGESVRQDTITKLSVDEQIKLARWTDMIIFDYLSGQHDRFARLMDDSEKQNDSKILSSSVPNVAIDKANHLWFYDNEAAFLDGYSLMYSNEKVSGRNESYRFLGFHDRLLQSSCVYRKSTFQAVIRLYHESEDDPSSIFKSVLEENRHVLIGPDGKHYVTNNPRWRFVLKNFRQRLFAIISHLKWCSETGA